MSDPQYEPVDPEAAEPDGTDPYDQTVEIVAEFDHRFEAEHARALLEEQGIHSIIWSDDGGGIYPNVGFIERYQIRVLSGVRERARDLLDEFGL
ncbi:MAG: hypothetical protein EA427_08080 [Spirochaetaceae bacterium]|nr:MAG: hypothetical protein EA427_08080 [Spirochaetaceae bacterium]